MAGGPVDSRRDAVHVVMLTDFVKETVEGRRWRKLMYALLAKAAAMGMSPETADSVARLGRNWVTLILRFAAK